MGRLGFSCPPVAIRGWPIGSPPLRLLSVVTRCLEGRFAKVVNLHVRSSEAVGCPLLGTAVARVLDQCPQQQPPRRGGPAAVRADPGTGTVRRPCNGQKTGGGMLLCQGRCPLSSAEFSLRQ